MNGTTIYIDTNTHRRLKIISANTNKKLYELIQEATDLLDVKYKEAPYEHSDDMSNMQETS